MSDETKPEGQPDIHAGSSQADLKSAADALLKANRKPRERAEDLQGDTAAEAGAELPIEQVLLALESEKEEMRGQLLRAIAETDNVRKRAERQVAETRIYAVEKFAADLLSVADNLARALSALPDDDRATLSEAGQNLLGGIEMTQKELHTALARHGVTPIMADPGGAFDPNLHQAVAQVPSDQPAGTIASLFQSGWKIGDRTLRAAMVAVSAGAAN